MPNTLIIRADASLAFGQGHTLRNRSLSDAFKAVAPDTRIIWAATPETFTLVPAIPANFETIALPAAPQATQMQALAAQLGSFGDTKPMMVVDGYHMDHETLDAARAQGIAGVSTQIDEKMNRYLGAHDFVVDYLPHNPADYKDQKLVAPHTRVMCDTPIVARRFNELAAQRKNWLAQRPAKDIKNILLINGGFNIGNMLEAMIDHVVTEPAKWNDSRFSVFMMSKAASFEQVKECIARANDAGINMTMFADDQNIPEHMVKADLYIGAAGLEPYELGAVGGAPSVVMPAGHNQDSVGAVAAERGAAINVGAYLTLEGNQLVRTPDSAARVKNAMQVANYVLSSPYKRASMSIASAAFCDGRGADRIAKAMLAKQVCALRP